MDLGTFSLSLAVKDLAKSKAFYEKLGFSVFHDASEHNYLILKSPSVTIGLFQGMFENNIMTFNPGWDAECKTLENFDDIRTLQKSLKNNGVDFESEADETTKGPASFVIKDPDGNAILVDQHV